MATDRPRPIPDLRMQLRVHAEFASEGRAHERARVRRAAWKRARPPSASRKRKVGDGPYPPQTLRPATTFVPRTSPASDSSAGNYLRPENLAGGLSNRK